MATWRFDPEPLYTSSVARFFTLQGVVALAIPGGPRSRSVPITRAIVTANEIVLKAVLR
jgi:hypothetical protein